MIALLLIALILILLPLIIYKLTTRNFDYWKKRKVVHPKPTPLFGNFADFMLFRSNLGIVGEKIYNEFPEEKYVGTLLGNNPVLLVRDPDLIKLIMTKDFFYFNSRGLGSTDLVKEPLNGNLFTTNGDHWRVLRQNLTPLFSSSKMKNMFHLMSQCGREFEEYARRQHAESDELDMRELMPKFSMDVIGTCAFGLQMNSMSGEDTEFRKMGKRIFRADALRSVMTFVRLLAPWLYKLLDLRVSDPTLTKFFVVLSRKVIEMREGRPPERHDFMDLLVELKQRGHIDGDSIQSMKPGGERRTVSLKLDENLLAAQSFIFFAAGFETSSTTMSYALYELALHKDVQERVHAEIDELLKKYEGKITYEMLNEANYLEMVMSETLRKYPVLAAITRQCTSRYTLPDGLVIEEGVRVHLPVYALHYDPQHYPNPHAFDPERFTPEASRERNQYTYMPFGEGQRLCIGMRFGKMQVMVGLISLLRNFSVEPCARTAKVIHFEPKNFVTTPKDGIWLKLTPRTK